MENNQFLIFSRGLATLELAVSVGLLVGLSVGHVTFLFLAPAHPSATEGEFIRPCFQKAPQERFF